MSLKKKVDEVDKAKIDRFLRLQGALFGHFDHEAVASYGYLRSSKSRSLDTTDPGNIYGARKAHARDRSVFSYEAMKARREAKAARIKPSAGGQEKKNEA